MGKSQTDPLGMRAGSVVGLWSLLTEPPELSTARQRGDDDSLPDCPKLFADNVIQYG
jgi:hypothetical protein